MSPSEDRNERETRRLMLYLSIVLAAGFALLHWRMVDFLERFAHPAEHHAVIVHTAPYPERYRILTFFLAEGLLRLGVQFQFAYAILRFTFTAASLYVFHRYLRGWFTAPIALIGYLLLAVVIPFSYMFYGLQVTDPLNMLLCFLAIWALRDGRDDWLFPIVAVGMFNRETMLLVPVLYAVMRARVAPIRRWVPRFVALAVLALGIYVWLHTALGVARSDIPTGLRMLRVFWRFNLENWAGWVQAFAFFNLGLLFAWRNLPSRPEFLRRSLPFMALYGVIHLSVGNLCEIRLFLPIMPFVIPLTLMELERRWAVPAP